MGDKHESPLRLLPTDAFVAEIHDRIDAATERVIVQLMTFDGDEAGQRFAKHLSSANRRGVVVRVLIDSFVETAVSDTPAGRPEVQDELAATNAMFERLRSEGIELRFTHPFGPLGIYTLARNHKKAFVVDDTGYLGGINISDHNVAWRDFMVATDHAELVEAIVSDFDNTWAGNRQAIHQRFGGLELITNERIEAVVDSLLLGAKREIIMASPYADDVGLCRVLAKAKAPVRRLITPATSNVLLFRALSPYIRQRLRRLGVQLESYERFSHAKFVLIDDEVLVVGSSNFGRHSYWCNQEICLLITDKAFLRQFRTAMLTDTAPLVADERRWRVAGAAVVSYAMHAVIATLRRTVAARVPPLSPR